MITIITLIDVNVPVRTAYNQWMQFEDFPRFMDGVKEVHQLDDRHLHWKAEIAGKEKEWDTEITEQLPNRRIAWRSQGGALNGGFVTFHPLSDAKSTVRLEVAYSPEGVLKNVRDGLGLMCFRMQGDVVRFKAFIEKRGRAASGRRDSSERQPTIPSRVKQHAAQVSR